MPDPDETPANHLFLEGGWHPPEEFIEEVVAGLRSAGDKRIERNTALDLINRLSADYHLRL